MSSDKFGIYVHYCIIFTVLQYTEGPGISIFQDGNVWIYSAQTVKGWKEWFKEYETIYIIAMSTTESRP